MDLLLDPKVLFSGILFVIVAVWAMGKEIKKFFDSLPSKSRLETKRTLPSSLTPIAMERLFEEHARDVIYYPRVFPPRHPATSLSFFGGRPLGPKRFHWPHDIETGKPRLFMGQLDLGQLPDVVLTKHLPKSGVMYFFGQEAWETDHNNVLYYDKPTDAWEEIELPSDMPRISEAGVSWNTSTDGLSYIFPRWEVTPTLGRSFPPASFPAYIEGFDWPNDEQEGVVEDARQTLSNLEYQRVFGPRVEWPAGVNKAFDLRQPEMKQALPPIWLSVQQVCRHISLSRNKAAEQDRFRALRAQLQAEASRHDAMTPFNQKIKASLGALLDIGTVGNWNEVVDQTIELAMTHSAETAALITPKQVEHVRHRVGDRRHQTGGYPDSVQGHYTENDYDHFLLLQIYPDSGQHWQFDALIQYWISHDDLEHQRWHNAFITVDSS